MSDYKRSAGIWVCASTGVVKSASAGTWGSSTAGVSTGISTIGDSVAASVTSAGIVWSINSGIGTISSLTSGTS